MTLREEIEAAGIVLPVRVEDGTALRPFVVSADNRFVAQARNDAGAHAIVAAINAAGEASDA